MTKTWLVLFEVVLVTLATGHASAATRYVDANGVNPVTPFASWSTAATNIQDAVDAATPGDQILVTNGIYKVGERISSDGSTNRLVVSKPLSLASVNGAAVTTIDGSNSVRCVYLGEGVTLVGFTLTKGTATNGAALFCASTNVQIANCQLTASSALNGGGVYSGTLSNCTISGNTVGFGGRGGGAYNSILISCSITGNSTLLNAGQGAGAMTSTLYKCIVAGNTCNGSGATFGGGAVNSALFNCTVTNNAAKGAGSSGGGVIGCVLSNCIVSKNVADSSGGGAAGCNLTNCTISLNRSSLSGGGVTGSTLKNCTLSYNNSGSGGGATYNSIIIESTVVGNTANYGGGAENGCVLYNCVISGNNAANGGGGASYCTLNNCTLSGNTAHTIWGGYGGGAYNSTLNNCIVYYNSGDIGADTAGCTLGNSCSSDGAGVGCITSAPLFVGGGNFQLQSNSPCINSGNNKYVAGTNDLNSNSRIKGGTVDMGAFEFQTPSSILSYAWAQQFGVVTDGSADFSDVDGDGLNNRGEWMAGTHPMDSSSVLKVLPPIVSSAATTVRWSSVTNVIYYLQRSASGPNGFSTIATNLIGLPNITSFVDASASDGCFLYRVGVQ